MYLLQNSVALWSTLAVALVLICIAVVLIILFMRKKRKKAVEPVSDIIKFTQNMCNSNVDDNEVLFIRVNNAVKTAVARFEVPFTHDAILIKGGGNMNLYRSGVYPVFNNEDEIKNWQSGVSVEIIYIPKETRVLIKWGTPNRLRYRDEASKKIITVGARGEFDVSVSDPLQFFKKVVGIKKEFNLNEFRKRFSETVATEFADLFLKIIDEKHLTYDRFAANKKEIGENMGAILSPVFEKDWGLTVLNFKIADFDLLDEEMETIESFADENKLRERIKEYLAELERIDDKQWEREKYLRQLELQDKNAYYEVMKVIGKDKKEDKSKENKCPNCGLEYKATDKFCPRCGKRVSKEPIICPDCGEANDSNTAFCAKCGKKLTNKG